MRHRDDGVWRRNLTKKQCTKARDGSTFIVVAQIALGVDLVFAVVLLKNLAVFGMAVRGIHSSIRFEWMRFAVLGKKSTSRHSLSPAIRQLIFSIPTTWDIPCWLVRAARWPRLPTMTTCILSNILMVYRPDPLRRKVHLGPGLIP